MKHDLEVLQYKAVKAHHSNHKLANVSQLLRVTKMRVQSVSYGNSITSTYTRTCWTNQLQFVEHFVYQTTLGVAQQPVVSMLDSGAEGTGSNCSRDAVG